MKKQEERREPSRQIEETRRPTGTPQRDARQRPPAPQTPARE